MVFSVKVVKERILDLKITMPLKNFALLYLHMFVTKLSGWHLAYKIFIKTA